MKEYVFSISYRRDKSDVSACLKMMSEVKARVLWYAIRDLALSWC